MGLIYLAPLTWETFSQRPHHFVRWYNEKSQKKVLWISSYPTRLPCLNDLKRDRKNEFLKSDIPDWLTVSTPFALPIEPIPGLSQVNLFFFRNIFSVVQDFIQNEQASLVVGKPSLLALSLLSKFKFKTSIYDAMDDFPFFYQGLSKHSMSMIEKKVSQNVDYVTTSSHGLLPKFKLNNKVEVVLNGFRKDLSPNRSNRKNIKCIGYVGTVAQWFDWSIVCKIAYLFPDTKIEIIGPVICHPPQSLPSNVALRGALPHEQALESLESFDAALIPFIEDNLTKGVDPIKYYEYTLYNLPILTTSFGEMRYRLNEDHVFLIKDDHTLINTVNQAFHFKRDKEYFLNILNNCSWDSRFSQSQFLSSLI